MYVIIDGPTLSLLLYSKFNSKGKEMGFLLGRKMEKVQSGITDSQIHTAEVHSYVYVTSFLPWPRHKSLYSRNGRLDQSLMADILEGSDQVIGWYSFRHQTSQTPSMKEFSIHHNLTEQHTTSTHQVKPEEFVFLLCTSLASRNLSTHSSDHTFMVNRNGRFVNIPATIKNLGDTSRMDYITTDNASPATSKVVSANMGDMGKHFVTPSGQVKQVVEMKNLISCMTKSLESTQTKVNNSEAVLSLLETEVSALRDRVASLEKEEMQRAFHRAQLQKQKEEEERQQLEKNQEEEEEEQMNKLLMDLGLTIPVDSGGSSLQREQNASTSPVPSSVVSLPKLEAGINPLYVNSLNEFETQDANLGNFDIPDNIDNGLMPNKQQTIGKVQLIKPSTNEKYSATNSHSSKTDSSISKNSVQSVMAVKDKPKDPFDFVMDEVKSELNVNKPMRQTRSLLHKNSGVHAQKSRSPSPKVTSCQMDKKKSGGFQSDFTADTNGHVSSNENGDEHDGPGQSEDSSPKPGMPNDVVTISSSPVF